MEGHVRRDQAPLGGQGDVGELPMELAGIGAGRVQEQHLPPASGALDINLGCALRQDDPVIAPLDLCATVRMCYGKFTDRTPPVFPKK
jgi:hypothetical protein